MSARECLRKQPTLEAATARCSQRWCGCSGNSATATRSLYRPLLQGGASPGEGPHQGRPPEVRAAARAPCWAPPAWQGPQGCGGVPEAGVCCSTCGSGLHRPGWGVAAWWTGGGQAPCLGLRPGKGLHHHHQEPAGHSTKLTAEPGCRGKGDPHPCASTGGLYSNLCWNPRRAGFWISFMGLGLQHRLHLPESTLGLAAGLSHSISLQTQGTGKLGKVPGADCSEAWRPEHGRSMR